MNMFDDEPDGDFLLAMKLAAEEAEIDYITRKHETEAKDFELALKLSNELNNNAIDTALSNSNSEEIINFGSFNECFNRSDNAQSPKTRNISSKLNETTTEHSFNNDTDPDYLLAIHLSQFDDSPPRKTRKTEKAEQQGTSSYMDTSISVVDPLWENIDPNPDIYALFVAFNQRFFWNRLNMVEVKWSPRMTLCAGICSYNKRAGHCMVKLSVPLLKLRPRKDLVETLLHEMIHAYLFVTYNDRDRDGHGPRFHSHMYRINKESGSNITVYHSFHEEVELYKTHWWRCDGPCRSRAPFFGFVKRASNRAPGPNDTWYATHRATCGGMFVKVREPVDYGQKKKKPSLKAKNNDSIDRAQPDISRYFNKSNMETHQLPTSVSSSSSFSNNFTASNQGLSRSAFPSDDTSITPKFSSHSEKVSVFSDLSESPRK